MKNRFMAGLQTSPRGNDRGLFVCAGVITLMCAMPKDERDLRQRLTHGALGAFLASLAAVSVQFWIFDINWWYVWICALFGFLLGWLIGEEAIDFFKSVFWWS